MDMHECFKDCLNEFEYKTLINSFSSKPNYEFLESILYKLSNNIEYPGLTVASIYFFINILHEHYDNIKCTQKSNLIDKSLTFFYLNIRHFWQGKVDRLFIKNFLNDNPDSLYFLNYQIVRLEHREAIEQSKKIIEEIYG